MKINPDDLVTQTTAGKMRGVSTQAIVSLVKRGRLKSVFIDGHTFVFRREVERFTPDIPGRPRSKNPKRKKAS
ncbi:MAG TPA: hypothetical protein VN937_10950 [Blastocatellia bacterium]|nr:hypothetical protein [Blastocatellia bacterium]